MPYNTTAIPPRREATGTTQLPLSRVRKIVQIDQDINMCSNAASVMITLATEMFIQHLAEQGHNVVKSERKPRRNIQYRDLAQAVHRNDNLEFLSDIVPKTVPFKEVKEKKAPTMSTITTNGNGNLNGNGESSKHVEAGQAILDGGKGMMNGTLNGFVEYGAAPAAGPSTARRVSVDVDDDSTIADPNEQLRMESRGASARVSNGSSVMNGHRDSEDVEMDD